MTKQDLKTGMRVRTRNGELYLVLKDCKTGHYGHQDLLFASFCGDYNIGDDYNNDLICVDSNDTDEDFDIVEVYTAKSGFADIDVLDRTSLKSIWKREEKKKMTVAEIEEKLGYEVEIVRETE